MGDFGDVIFVSPLAEYWVLGILMIVGIVLCSLLFVIAALLHGGEVMERRGAMLSGQTYLVLTAMMQLSLAEDRLLAQVAGFLVFALGIASIILRKNNFRAARYCIALGATVAACGVLLF